MTRGLTLMNLMRRGLGVAALAGLLAFHAAPGLAQTTPAPAVPSAPSATPAPEPNAPAPAQPDAAAPVAPPAAEAAPPSAGDTSSAQIIEVAPRPVAVMRGSSSWDDGYATLMGAFKQINAEVASSGLKPASRPFAAFIETDDQGFKYEAMVAIDAAPPGREQLSAAVKLGMSPGGKAMKFQHRAAYDDIDSTYEAITAFLDEKGLEAKNLFVEEYLNEVKGADDNAMQIDIYVFLK